MSDFPFIHLHNRSEYSLLSSALRINDIAALAAENGMSAVALTDRMNLHACMKFYDACLRNGLRPIIGAEIAVEAFSEQISIDPLSPAVYDIVLLAENNKGYEKLCELITRIHLESDGRNVFAKKEWIDELAGDWIVLSGGNDGEIFRLLLNNDEKKAREAGAALAHSAGAGKFYIELQWHGLDDEKKVLPRMIELAKKMNIPIVATNQCLYAKRADAPALELLKKIEKGVTVNSISELKPESDLFYFRSPDSMIKIFKNAPEAIENSTVIAEQCAVELQTRREYIAPHFECPAGKKSFQYLKELCEAGLVERYPDWKDDSAETRRKLTKQKRKNIEKRLKYELETIQNMGFVSYFLIVADFVSFAKKNDIPVGPGRGSAAGSLVSFLLGITDVDPLDYGLLFERFLNPARKKMPDIDMDFCELRRTEVIDYVREKYGEDKVAQIATFSTMRYKAAVRDTGRILNTPIRKVEQICSLLSDFARNHKHKNFRIISQALEQYHSLRELYLYDKDAKELLDLALKIEDLPRNLSTHAAGVVISPKPLRTVVPLLRGNGGDIITQFDMHAVERVGLLKMDFLGLSTLTIINDTAKMIKETHGEKINLSKLPLDDDLTYEFLRKGDVIGVFQLETSAGMRQLVRQLQPDRFDDIVALLALYRPGAMSERDVYVRRRHGKEKIEYLHPKLKPILKDTCGIMLYQEQVMQVLHSIAGYSLSEADIFRQIMSKKLLKKIDAEREKFISGAVKKGVSTELAVKLFERVAQFAGYGFNKSHATAYAFIAYRTAWLKAHYPAEFFAALMNSRLDTPEKFFEYKSGCEFHKIKILQPDINKSKVKFSVEKTDNKKFSAIRYGLAAVRNVGPAAAEKIIEEREENGPFKNIDDFVRRINHKIVNRKAVECLIKAGAADCFGAPRQRMCLIAEDAATNWERGGVSELQRSFFDSFDDADKPVEKSRAGLENVNEWDLLTRLAFEKEMLGIYVTGHPLDKFAATLRAVITKDSQAMGYQPTEEKFMAAENSGKQIMGGLILKIDWRVSKKQTVYGVLTFEDLHGKFDALLWSELVEKFRDKLKTGDIWIANGFVKSAFNKRTLSVDNLFRVENTPKHASELIIDLNKDGGTELKMKKLRALISENTGKVPVVLKLTDESNKKSLIKLPQTMLVSPTEQFLSAAENIFGKENIKIKI